MTRTLQYVTVAGMFAIVPMALLPRMRSETYILHDSSSADLDSMDPAGLGPLVHAVSICFGNVFIMKSVVASQNIFLGSSEVYTGTTKTELFIIGSLFVAPMHKLQYFGKAATTKISSRLLYGYARARTPGNSFAMDLDLVLHLLSLRHNNTNIPCDALPSRLVD